jgi:hypothetical protein
VRKEIRLKKLKKEIEQGLNAYEKALKDCLGSVVDKSLFAHPKTIEKVREGLLEIAKRFPRERIPFPEIISSEFIKPGKIYYFSCKDGVIPRSLNDLLRLGIDVPFADFSAPELLDRTSKYVEKEKH